MLVQKKRRSPSDTGHFLTPSFCLSLVNFLGDWWKHRISLLSSSLEAANQMTLFIVFFLFEGQWVHQLWGRSELFLSNTICQYGFHTDYELICLICLHSLSPVSYKGESIKRCWIFEKLNKTQLQKTTTPECSPTSAGMSWVKGKLKIYFKIPKGQIYRWVIKRLPRFPGVLGIIPSAINKTTKKATTHQPNPKGVGRTQGF